ncbi:hypothetical protein SAMN05216464_11086 [Mucilaginibacter pineti]|uniref:Uncharacterized protein n=1 Tax=Mucilaginibacter pineti TaxID=1391627 RepID=A0A1G7GD54_9SPHI|nr:hypothetical protein [Mucilaginibacter pineti]SDE86005.1 hypothetical protein SAMN05216464_11086 [Mucilaginibacter pineti]
MKKYTSIFFLFALAIGCKKKEQLKESTWTANGETFTAVAKPSLGKAIAVLASDDAHNRFSIAFNAPYFPTEGTLTLGTPAADGDVNVNFYYHDVFYIQLNSNTTVNVSLFNNKTHYTLPPLWFFNYYNHADSVLIAGDFYEP